MAISSYDSPYMDLYINFLIKQDSISRLRSAEKMCHAKEEMIGDIPLTVGGVDTDVRRDGAVSNPTAWLKAYREVSRKWVEAHPYQNATPDLLQYWVNVARDAEGRAGPDKIAVEKAVVGGNTVHLATNTHKVPVVSVEGKIRSDIGVFSTGITYVDEEFNFSTDKSATVEVTEKTHRVWNYWDTEPVDPRSKALTAAMNAPRDHDPRG